MNLRILFRVLGLLVLLVAASMLLCEIYSFLSPRRDPHGAHDLALFKAFLITVGLGVGLWWSGRGSGNDILRKEAIAIVGLGWIVCAAVGAIPYMLCTPAMNPAAAFFESASGFTTTGSTVIPDLDEYPESILLWRATTQWLGGLGILVLFVALLSTLGVGSKSIFRHESTAQIGYGFHSRIRETALRFVQIYLVLSAACCAGLVVLGMPFFDALLHTFATVSTGGFSSKNTSITFYDSAAIDAWLCVFMTLGGTSFVLIAWVLRGNLRRLRIDEEFRAYLAILLAATLVIAADLVVRQDTPLLPSLRWSSFQVVSIMTTTGFGTADFDQWPTLSKAILVLLMFVGGCAGSTSGGLKVSRVVIFFKTCGQQLVNAFRPNQHVPLKLNGELIGESQRASVAFFVGFTGFVVALSTLAVTLLEPALNHVSSFTAVCTTLFNVGPGLDAVGPMRNFAGLSPATHLFLGFLMILGRLEFFAVLVLLMPALWRRY